MWIFRSRSGPPPGAAFLPLALGLAALLLPALSLAQGRTVIAVDTVRALQPWAPHAEYSFLRLVMPEHPEVATTINRHLAIDFLEADPDTAGDRLFDKVWGEPVTGWMPRLSYLEWQVHHPLPEVVDVELSAEGCAAYCEGFTRHYVYDLRDGHYLAFDSLFTQPGLVAVNDTLDKLWRTTLKDHVDSLETGSSGPDLAPEDKELAQRVAALYRDCLEERLGRPPYAEIQPLPMTMRFFIARCAAHVEQELDELDPVSFELPYGWLAPYLRPALRSIFR